MTTLFKEERPNWAR